MLFEGSEKKVEMSLRPGSHSFRSLGRAFWSEVVQSSGAKILSEMSNDHLDAYLLSESSLFVYDQHMIMITCGRTNLVQGVMKILERVEKDQIAALFYERKHEVFPRKQPTTFFNDIDSLKQIFKGRSFRFGNEDEHHIYLFHLDQPYEPASDDVTVEILMHGVDGRVRDLFTRTDDLCTRCGVREILPGFQVDDFVFDPVGYSLNAIANESYYTIHVTPQEVGSFVSFETNYDYRQSKGMDVREIIGRVIDIFQPQSFDLVLFEPRPLEPLQIQKYVLKAEVVQPILCGYNVGFYNYFLPTDGPVRAYELK